MPEVGVVRHVGPIVRVATWHNIALSVFVAPARLEALGPIRECVVDLMRRYPDGIGCMTVLPRDMVDSPDLATRREADAIAKLVREHKIADAYVLEGNGFVKATARAVIFSSLLLAGTSRIAKVFDDIETGAAWIRSRMNVRRGELGELVAFIRSVRELGEPENRKSATHQRS